MTYLILGASILHLDPNALVSLRVGGRRLAEDTCQVERSLISPSIQNQTAETLNTSNGNNR